MMKSFCRLFSIFLILIMCSPVFSGPVVINISGQWSEGNQLVISGSGFGSFGGEIVSWDDFEAHNQGDYINGSSPQIGPKWSCQYGYSGSGAIFDTTKSHGGSKAFHIDWSKGGGATIRGCGWAGKGPFDRLYVSYWRWMQGDYDHKATPVPNHKQFYLFGNGDNDLPQAMILMPAGTSTWAGYNNVGASENNLYNKTSLTYSKTAGVWNRWETFVEMNDVGVSNGTFLVWVDGILTISSTSYKHNWASSKALWDDFRLGHMAQQFTDTAKAWFDDLYIATTQARVEICDTATWSDCRHREIQIVSSTSSGYSWNSSSITIDVHQGGFSDAGSKYLYIVTADGSVNEDGLLLGGDITPVDLPESQTMND